MCGIVGYVGRVRLAAGAILECMELLQADREKWERTPVGGHGAGLAGRGDRGEFTAVKVGGDGDPVAALGRKISRAAPSVLETGSDVLVGHVRRAVPRFLASVPRPEAAQPYVASCWDGLEVIGIHNGFARNYERLLTQPHTLESSGFGPVDSEVLPHLVEELLLSGIELPEAMARFLRRVSGGNAAFFAVRQHGAAHVAVVHVGRSRGLTVWENGLGEIAFISRPRCLGAGLRSVIEGRGFRTVFQVGRHEAARFLRTWTLPGAMAAGGGAGSRLAGGTR